MTKRFSSLSLQHAEGFRKFLGPAVFLRINSELFHPVFQWLGHEEADKAFPVL